MAFASGMGAIVRRGARAVFGRRSHRRRSASSTPARWRSCRGRASASGSRRRSSTARARRVRRSGAARPHHARAGRDPVQPAARAVRPRRARRDHGSVHRRRLDVRDAARPAPLAHGVDLSLHSATKGIAGHNDATLGVIAGERELLEAIWAYGVLHGATPSPFDALNALRGVRTLAVRTAHQAATAPTLRRWLERASRRSGRALPRPAAHPQHDLAKRQMRQFGTVLAFDLAGGHEAVRRLFDRCGWRAGHVARRTGDAGVPSDDDHPRQPHARGTSDAGVSPTGWCGCRSGSRIPTTSSPTFSGRWLSACQPHREAASTIGSSAGPNANQFDSTSSLGGCDQS